MGKKTKSISTNISPSLAITCLSIKLETNIKRLYRQFISMARKEIVSALNILFTVSRMYLSKDRALYVMNGNTISIIEHDEGIV